MRAVLVWDLASRFFHWAIACSLSLAKAIGFLADKYSLWFQWHMRFGLVALFLVVVRLLMGVVGTPHARFSSNHRRTVPLSEDPGNTHPFS